VISPRLPIALLALGLGSGLGCRREAPPAPPTAPPARPSPPAQPAFTHPLLAGASTDAVREDCSKRALATVLERLRAAAGQPPSTAPAAVPRPRKRPSPGCGDVEAREVREALLPRVAACVGRDGPLDVEWAMASSATLSLGVCLDCRRSPGERGSRCGRVRDLVSRIEGGLRDRQAP
jgi:hypothetical protein